MTGGLVIRAAGDRQTEIPDGADRLRLLVFAALAAICHLLAFMAFSGLGFDSTLFVPDMEPPPERFLELVLEVNEPTAEPAPDDPTAAVQAPEPTADPADGPVDDPAPLPTGASVLEGGGELSSASGGEDRTINLEETAPQFKNYNSQVRTAVARRWILPPAARSNFQSGRFVAVMTLDNQGRVLVIAVEESSGVPALDFAAMEALRGGAPYPPFPPELSGHDSLRFRLHFDYRAVMRRPGSSGTAPPDS